MLLLKRAIIVLVLLDNFLTNLPKRYIFRGRWVLGGKCRQCGECCREIYLKMTLQQAKSQFFTRLAIQWITWLFDFILIKIDYEDNCLVFACKHRRKDGRCGNYFWRPNICRNYPLLDYFEKPTLLPGCGYSARLRKVS